MTKQRNPIMRFGAFLLKTFRLIRAVILNLLFVLLLALFIGSMIGSPSLPIPASTLLVLNPQGNVVEQSNSISGVEQFVGQPNLANTQIILSDLLKVIEAAAIDDRVKGLLIEPTDITGAAFSHLQEIGSALGKFKASGKPVFAMSGNYTQAQYYLASFADEIMINPMGTVDLQGFGTWQVYFRSALDTLGVKAHVFRVGTYKAAVEPYERDDMSAAAKQNYGELFGDLWDLYLRDISERRNLPQNALSELIETYDEALSRYEGDTALLAQGEGLVDRVESQPLSIAYIDSVTSGADSALPRTDYQRYLKSVHQNKPAIAAAHIGLIMASGEITDGEAPRGTIGGDSLAALIRDATENDNLAALVLRINSPGGSAFASEVIRGELEAFKATGRPLLVSMGSVAASGGYWIATPADEIWASPSTITGSIGIYGVLPTFEDTFAKLGITLDGTGTTSLSGLGTPGKALSGLAERSIQLTIENGYRRFLGLVADSRQMSTADVDLIAQGQVWSGMRALNNGLVDQLGSLQQTLDAAAARAGLDGYDVKLIETPMSAFEQLLQELTANRKARSFAHWVAEISGAQSLPPMLQSLVNSLQVPTFLNDPNALYLHCEVCSQISN